MRLTVWEAVNGYTYVVLAILFAVSLMDNVVSNHSKKYTRLLLLTLILLTGDSLSRIGLALNSKYIIISEIGNFILFALDPFAFVFAADYIFSWMTNEKKDLFCKVFVKILLGLSTFNVTLCVISEIFHINIFYIYRNGVYHRGPFFLPRAIVLFILLVSIALFTLINKNNIEKRYRLSLVLFPFFILAGGIMQVVAFYRLWIIQE